MGWQQQQRTRKPWTACKACSKGWVYNFRLKYDPSCSECGESFAKGGQGHSPQPQPQPRPPAATTAAADGSGGEVAQQLLAMVQAMGKLSSAGLCPQLGSQLAELGKQLAAVATPPPPQASPAREAAKKFAEATAKYKTAGNRRQQLEGRLGSLRLQLAQAQTDYAAAEKDWAEAARLVEEAKLAYDGVFAQPVRPAPGPAVVVVEGDPPDLDMDDGAAALQQGGGPAAASAAAAEAAEQRQQDEDKQRLLEEEAKEAEDFLDSLGDLPPEKRARLAEREAKFREQLRYKPSPPPAAPSPLGFSADQLEAMAALQQSAASFGKALASSAGAWRTGPYLG